MTIFSVHSPDFPYIFGVFRLFSVFLTLPLLCHSSYTSTAGPGQGQSPALLRQLRFLLFHRPFAFPPFYLMAWKKGLTSYSQAPLVGIPPFSAYEKTALCLIRAVISVGWQSIFGCFIVYPFVHRRKHHQNSYIFIQLPVRSLNLIFKQLLHKYRYIIDPNDSKRPSLPLWSAAFRYEAFYSHCSPLFLCWIHPICNCYLIFIPLS